MLTSLLTPTAVVRTVESGWGVRVRGCQVLKHGSNDHYRVDLDDGSWLLRISGFHPHGLPQMPFELAVTTLSARAGVRVNAPRPTPRGDLTVDVDAPEGTRPAALFSWAPGSPPTPADATAYGRQLAAFHAATASLDADPGARMLDLDYLVTTRLDAARVLLQEVDGASVWLDGFATDVMAAVGALQSGALDVGVVHGDAHLGNGHVDNGEVCLFDTEFLGIGWRAYDLATFRWALGFWRGTDVGEAYADFLDGYRTVRVLRDADLAAVPALLAARCVWLFGHWARSESPAPNSIWHSPAAIRPVLDLAQSAQADLA